MSTLERIGLGAAGDVLEHRNLFNITTGYESPG
jgi:hypothetical protein